MLCGNYRLNEAEVKLIVKSKDGTSEKWVCSECAQGEYPWNQQEHAVSHSEFQDDIEEVSVVKQILQHLATKHGLNFREVAFQEEKRYPTHNMTSKDIARVGKFGCASCYAVFKEDIVDTVRRVQDGQFEHVGKMSHSSHHKLAIKKQTEEKTNYSNILIEKQKSGEAAIIRDEIKTLKHESEMEHDE